MKTGPDISESLENARQWDAQTSEAKEESPPDYFLSSPNSFVLRSVSENPLWIRRQLRQQSRENELRDSQQAVTIKKIK